MCRALFSVHSAFFYSRGTTFHIRGVIHTLVTFIFSFAGATEGQVISTLMVTAEIHSDTDTQASASSSHPTPNKLFMFQYHMMYLPFAPAIQFPFITPIFSM